MVYNGVKFGGVGEHLLIHNASFQSHRVRCYEEIEYVVDILKMLFLVALILSNIIINL